MTLLPPLGWPKGVKLKFIPPRAPPSAGLLGVVPPPLLALAPELLAELNPALGNPLAFFCSPPPIGCMELVVCTDCLLVY